MLTPIVKKLIDERIQLLNTRNESLTRSIQSYKQRAADYQADLSENVRELVELKSLQSTLEAVTAIGSQIHDETIVEVQETRRGLPDPDDDSYTPKHTSIIVG
jgi:copper oxidase (laccase) domain-containing protein